jgi:L-2-hydroxyglutarate oxidase
MPPPATFDVAVIGGGIVGLATARALLDREPGLSIAVLETEAGLAMHQSGRNSGVVHSGLYYRPGSLKAELCARGREALARFCEERGLPYSRTGKLVLATAEPQVPALEELARRGEENGLAGLERLGVEEIRQHEPGAQGVAGLWVPQTGLVDYPRVAEALGEEIVRGGGEVRTRSRLHAVLPTSGGLELRTVGGPLSCGRLVNCAGLQSDRVARLCGVRPRVRIFPFRGEYFEVVGESRERVRGLIYPVPDPTLPFLGVHLTRGLEGRVLAGPNAVPALAREAYLRRQISLRDTAGLLAWPGTWRLARRFKAVGWAEVARATSRRRFLREARALVPAIRLEDLRPARSGVRAQAVDRQGRLLDDFHFEKSERALHVLNAPSPAATSALAIGEHLADQVLSG